MVRTAFRIFYENVDCAFALARSDHFHMPLGRNMAKVARANFAALGRVCWPIAVRLLGLLTYSSVHAQCVPA